MFALTPRTPIVPFMLASQPGAAIVNCHGSLCVIVRGAVSLGASSREPARRGATVANVAAAKNNNLNLMRRFLLSPTSKTEKKFLSFYYIWKDKNGGCFRFAFGSRGILRDELLQSATGFADQIVGGCRAGGK
jgi:hypothetical protein